MPNCSDNRRKLPTGIFTDELAVRAQTLSKMPLLLHCQGQPDLLVKKPDKTFD
jgi:hypothetical protein